MEDFVTNVLTSHGIIKYRDLFSTHQYHKSNMPLSCDALIHPFTLTQEEYKLASGLADIAVSQVARPITLLQKDALIPILNLKPKRVVTAQVEREGPVDSSGSASAAIKIKQKRAYSRKRDEEVVDDNVRRRKRTRIDDILTEKVNSNTRIVETSYSTIKPAVLKSIMKKIFDEFWDEQLG